MYVGSVCMRSLFVYVIAGVIQFIQLSEYQYDNTNN